MVPTNQKQNVFVTHERVFIDAGRLRGGVPTLWLTGEGVCRARTFTDAASSKRFMYFTAHKKMGFAFCCASSTTAQRSLIRRRRRPCRRCRVGAQSLSLPLSSQPDPGQY